MSKTKNNNEIKIQEMNDKIKELDLVIEDQKQVIEDLQIKLEKSINNTGRKSQVLELLRKYSSISILEISNELMISTKNVSSQLTYLRTDGYQIFTDPKGRKVLVEKEVQEKVQE